LHEFGEHRKRLFQRRRPRFTRSLGKVTFYIAFEAEF